MMKYQRVIIEVPELPDEAAVYLHKFVEAMMHAIDDQYYKQIHRYYSNRLVDRMRDCQLTHNQDSDESLV